MAWQDSAGFSSDRVWSNEAACEWAEGYPIGNGRLGVMVLGGVRCDRHALNHDRLWRRYWRYGDRNTGADMAAYRRLCLEKRWDEAYRLMKDRIAISGEAIYVNPFVPLGDLYIRPHHRTEDRVEDYRRVLDLDRAVVEVSYRLGAVRHVRESFVSWPAGVAVTRLRADRAARTAGTVWLTRMVDGECEVVADAGLDELVLLGRFEEGLSFAAVVRLVHRGGRLTGGVRHYEQAFVPRKEEELNGFKFGFRQEKWEEGATGVSTCVDAADEVLILTAMATEQEDADPIGRCRGILDRTPADFDLLLDQHVQDHRKLYRRVSLSLGSNRPAETPTPRLVDRVRQHGEMPPVLFEQLFNTYRYLAIACGRPAARHEPYKAPINLQGLWNEDPRPAWDCDYHLDLNIEMCYWPLGMVGLAEFFEPMVDWAWALLPQAQRAARDIYGVDGAYYSGTCDAENVGNVDDLGMLATGVTAWLGQMLWMAWRYHHDEVQLRHRIYPILREIGRFYERFLVEDDQGRLVPVPSGSPEICPADREYVTMLSVPSTFDLELIRELFENLIASTEVLDVDRHKREAWSKILDRLPMPVINEEGRLLEWLEDYEVTDPGHRHRSHCVGFCPGDRITAEDTPEYSAGVRKAIEKRHAAGSTTSCSIDLAWDIQMFARLYDPGKAMELLKTFFANHALGNLLVCLCQWREDGGLRWFGEKKIYQIEAGLGAMAAITEMLLQDRRDLIRLLPALPSAWPEGQVSGLRTRNGFEVDLTWREGRLVEARLRCARGGICRVKCFTGQRLQVLGLEGRIKTTHKDDEVRFGAEAGREYLVKPM